MLYLLWRRKKCWKQSILSFSYFIATKLNWNKISKEMFCFRLIFSSFFNGFSHSLPLRFYFFTRTVAIWYSPSFAFYRQKHFLTKKIMKISYNNFLLVTYVECNLSRLEDSKLLIIRVTEDWRRRRKIDDEKVSISLRHIRSLLYCRHVNNECFLKWLIMPMRTINFNENFICM